MGEIYRVEELQHKINTLHEFLRTFNISAEFDIERGIGKATYGPVVVEGTLKERGFVVNIIINKNPVLTSEVRITESDVINDIYINDFNALSVNYGDQVREFMRPLEEIYGSKGSALLVLILTLIIIIVAIALIIGGAVLVFIGIALIILGIILLVLAPGLAILISRLIK